jgi:hypothetical protein
VAELRLAGANTMEAANRVLEGFLPRFNARFGVSVSQSGSAYRRMPQDLDLVGVLCFLYQRTVAGDNTLRFAGRTLQIQPGLERPSYAYARVEVQERLDGSLAVCYQSQAIVTTQSPDHPVKLRARKTAWVGSPTIPKSPIVPVSVSNCGNNHKPDPNHPWRKPLLVTKSPNN